VDLQGRDNPVTGVGLMVCLRPAVRTLPRCGLVLRRRREISHPGLTFGVL